MESNRAATAGENWRDHNNVGLALSSQRRWPEAIVAFEHAIAMLDELSTENPSDRDTLEAEAQVSANLAQAHFQAGYVTEALPFAERSCAIRVTLYGEEALSVARARADLAVVLGANGQTDHAISLLNRAIWAVEQKRGDGSEFLVSMLENAARLLLTAHQPAAAALYASRMLTLVRALNKNSAAAEQLVAMIASARSTNRHVQSVIPLHTFSNTDSANASDDLLLREAVAETDELLRSTPSNNLAVPDSAALMDSLPDVATSYADTVNEFPEDAQHNFDAVAHGTGLIDSLDLKDELDAEMQNAMVVPVKPAKILDDAAFDLVEPPPPTLNKFPVRPRSHQPANPLGFEVQYGLTPETTNEAEILEERPPIARIVHITESVPAVRPAVRAVGGVRRGRTQVLEPRRIWYVVIAAIAFLAAIGVTVWLIPLLH